MIDKPHEDTDYKMKKCLNCSGKLLDLSTKAVMGILNLTPDSFHDGDKNLHGDHYIEHTGKMINDGATIIDVGGQSTRPGSELLDEESEWSRIKKPLAILVQEFPQMIFSIDTFYSSVAKRAIDTGASIINDVSGGNIDAKMFSVVAKMKVPYILMHMKGTPQNMQVNPEYKDIVLDVLDFFSKKLYELKLLGLTDIILDPGFGFGKTLDQNYTLLKHLNVFKICEAPILAGLSRKSMITKVLRVGNENSLNGTSVLNTIALINGADMLRVHDVKEAKEAIDLVNKMKTV